MRRLGFIGATGAAIASAFLPFKAVAKPGRRIVVTVHAYNAPGRINGQFFPTSDQFIGACTRIGPGDGPTENYIFYMDDAPSMERVRAYCAEMYDKIEKALA